MPLLPLLLLFTSSPQNEKLNISCQTVDCCSSLGRLLWTIIVIVRLFGENGRRRLAFFLPAHPHPHPITDRVYKEGGGGVLPPLILPSPHTALL